MKAGPDIRAFAVMAILILGMSAWGQEERRVSIVPERPLAGSVFVVEVILPGERAEAVVPLEPRLQGPARYTGADVHPGRDGIGLESAVIEYRFMAEGAGTIDIVGLSARSGGRLLQFGSWSIDAVADTHAPTRRYGSWSAPDSVMAREVFTVTALGPDGKPAVCPGFAVEGTLFEPVSGKPGLFYTVVLEPGILRLPRLELGVEGGQFELKPFSVAVKGLPAGTGEVSAVGGPWRLELVTPRPGETFAEDGVVAWELRAIGPGWPGLAASPSLTVEAPGGSPVPSGAGFAFSGRAGTAPESFSGRRGAFRLSGPGVYTIRPLPYAWFETETRRVRQATVAPVRITVAVAPAPEWKVPEAVVSLALTRLAALGAHDASWIPVSEAAERGDWETARIEAYRAAGIAYEHGSLAAVSLRGSGASQKAFALAAASLVAASPGSGSAEEPLARVPRAEALAVFLRLERAAFPARGVAVMADAADASFGNLDRPSYVLPPFGWLCVAGMACVAAAAGLAIPGLLRRRQGKPGVAPRTAAVLLAVAGAAALIMAIASVVERASPRFVSLGGPARAVPSDLAEEREIVAAGRMGRVLESSAQWSFVELDGGGAVWLSARDIARY